jgi:hypothetical protein
LEVPVDVWVQHIQRQAFAAAKSGRQGGVKKITSFTVSPLPSQLFYATIWSLLALGRDIIVDKSHRDYTLRTLNEVCLTAIAKFCGFENVHASNGLDSAVNFLVNTTPPQGGVVVAVVVCITAL